MTHYEDTDTAKANKRYIRRSMKRRILERDEEYDLAVRWQKQEDETALHKLINAYARIVVSMASKFRHYGLPQGDLIQEGNVGLMKAAARFDAERGVRFSTYANWWIKAEMQDYVLRNSSIVRTGTTSAQKSLFFNLRRLRAQFMAEDESESLTDDGRRQIAETLGVRLEDVEKMEQRLSGIDQSLNAPLAEEGVAEWQDMLYDEDQPNPEEIVIGMKDAETRSAWLSEALGGLDEREQHIIRERRLTDEVVTLEDLGRELGVSKERVRQLEARAMDKLKDALLQKAHYVGELIPGL